MKMVTPRILISAAFVVGMFCSGAMAEMWFYEDFESDLSAWTGKDGGAHHGIIVADPMNPGNQVLTFTELNGYGDIFTRDTFSHLPERTYQLSFDYLGLVNQVPGGSGGFAGLSESLPGEHVWYYGTNTTSGAAAVMIDDGQWHHYDYDFTVPTTWGDSFHLMFEDFRYALPGGTAGDAYFDNISLHTPLPGAVLLGVLGLGTATWRLRRPS